MPLETGHLKQPKVSDFYHSFILTKRIMMIYLFLSAESDLVHRPMGNRRQLYKSAAHQMIGQSIDHMKNLTQWLQSAITQFNEFDEV